MYQIFDVIEILGGNVVTKHPQSLICARYGSALSTTRSTAHISYPGQMMRIQQRPKLQCQEGKASRPINPLPQGAKAGSAG